jgi:hypothetical protein
MNNKKQLISMIADSKKEAAKALATADALKPRSLKELEEYTQARKQAVLPQKKEDVQVKKTNQLV